MNLSNTIKIFAFLFTTVALAYAETGSSMQKTIASEFTIQSPAFGHQQLIPRQYTGDGKNISPPLVWSNLPTGTESLVLICEDPDAPSSKPWIHWIMYKIPATANGLRENIAKRPAPPTPSGAHQGMNSWGQVGYGGPTPPAGHGLHHYHFKLYALDTDLHLRPGLNKRALLQAISGCVIGQTELIGTYQR